MKLFDGGLIILIIIGALSYVHYHKFHDGKFVDTEKIEKQS